MYQTEKKKKKKKCIYIYTMIKNGTHCQYDVRVTIHDSLACSWIDYSSKFSSVFFTVFFKFVISKNILHFPNGLIFKHCYKQNLKLGNANLTVFWNKNRSIGNINSSWGLVWFEQKANRFLWQQNTRLTISLLLLMVLQYFKASCHNKLGRMLW